MPNTQARRSFFEEAKIMAWWFFFPIAFFGGLVLILALVALIVWTLFSGMRPWNSRSYPQRSDTALQTLRERYAKGEITKEQFEKISKDLGQH